ncbi:hypothetical protein ASC80_06395 [Afipia sp. Root123D2]|uniref:hypothetical protein n=1 Tax=Afipia sp. Root123D2 TaxID=1736436 RepID=UPI0006F958D1|nr:hypothetical protein [Afipia sp. Root123D2]KQW22953.1 hypothetical protein ASC80_06395 [Afipia sp. Root123D2]
MAIRKTTPKVAPQTEPRKVIPESLSSAMLSLFRCLWASFEDKQNNGKSDDYAEFDAAYATMRNMSYVRPITAVDALAQVVFLYDEAGDVDQAHMWDEKRCKEWSNRMARRAAGLALWIERSHGIDRRDHGLADFCNDQLASRYFPHQPAEAWHRAGAPAV